VCNILTDLKKMEYLMNIKTIIVLFLLSFLMSCASTENRPLNEEQDTGTFRVMETKTSVQK
jgi:uncharacterized iron-regulated protein